MSNADSGEVMGVNDRAPSLVAARARRALAEEMIPDIEAIRAFAMAIRSLPRPRVSSREAQEIVVSTGRMLEALASDLEDGVRVADAVRWTDVMEGRT